MCGTHTVLEFVPNKPERRSAAVFVRPLAWVCVLFCGTAAFHAVDAYHEHLSAPDRTQPVDRDRSDGQPPDTRPMMTQVEKFVPYEGPPDLGYPSPPAIPRELSVALIRTNSRADGRT